jgi:cytoskeletal protein CcmA (bactofilin family)
MWNKPNAPKAPSAQPVDTRLDTRLDTRPQAPPSSTMQVRAATGGAVVGSPAPSATPYGSGLSQQTYAAPSAGNTRIGSTMKIKGEIRCEEDLFIDGEVEGKIELGNHQVTIGQNGKVKANIRAREVSISGNVNGTIEASHKISLSKDARLIGDIQTSGIMIEDGADFKGSINIIRKEAAAKA